MARRARVVIPDWPQNITQRGNHRQTVFFSQNDRIIYLELLRRYIYIDELSLIGYCLISNYARFVLISPKEEALSLGVGQLNQDFSRLQNMRCGRNVHLWQYGFFSCPVQHEGIWEVLVFVKLNPMRAHPTCINIYAWVMKTS
jgi:putative transposase